MTTVRKFILRAAAMLFVAGCGTLNNRLAPERIGIADIPQASGVILLSTGASRACTSNGTFLRALPSGQPPTTTEIVAIAVDGSAVSSDFEEHHGFIYAVILPAGDYYFAPFTLRGFGGGQAFPRFDFTVRAKEIVYLGEVFATTNCAVLTPTVLEIRDRQERDFALLRKRNPVLASYPMTTRILNISGHVRG